MTTSARIIYETVTPESAEQGDYAECGWYLPGGWFHALRDENGQNDATLEDSRLGAFDLTLREAIKEALSLGCYEGQVSAGCISVRSVDADQGDCSTADETFYSLFIKGLTPGSTRRVVRLLKSKGVHFYGEQS